MHRGKGIGLAVIVFVCAFTSSSVFADTIFNFNSDLIGTSTPFTDTVSGLGATFTSSHDPGGFAVTPTFFSTLTGNVLLDPGPAQLNNLTLTILFSAEQASISMNFATNSVLGVPFHLDVFDGTSAVGGATASGVIPPGFFFPEGTISFSGSTFNRVVLSAPTAPHFAIDNVSVNAAAVPEPSSLSLLAFDTLGVIAITRLRRLEIGTSRWSNDGGSKLCNSFRQLIDNFLFC